MDRDLPLEMAHVVRFSFIYIRFGSCYYYLSMDVL